MVNPVKCAQVRCLPHVMGRFVDPIDGIHCDPYADREKRTSRKQAPGKSVFSAIQRHFFGRFRMDVGSSRY